MWGRTAAPPPPPPPAPALSPAALGVTAVVGLLLVHCLLTSHRRKRALCPSPDVIRRRMSFCSAACADGPMPAHAKMSPSDPIINAVVVFDHGAPTRAAVEAAIQPLFHYERFRSRKVKVHGEWYWEVLPGYQDAKAHVIEEPFKGATVDDLFRRLEAWAQKPLHVPADAPAFEFALLRNQGKGPSAVICRINHAIGDGLSLAKLIPHVFKDKKGQPLPMGEKFRRREAGFKPRLSNPLSLLSSFFTVLGTPKTTFDSGTSLFLWTSHPSPCIHLLPTPTHSPSTRTHII